MRLGKGQAPRDGRAAAVRASFAELVMAVFKGAPSPQAAETYSAQLTAIISIYLCLVAVFLISLYIRKTKRFAAGFAEQRQFKVSIAWSAVFAILMIALRLVYFYFSIE
jgi:hypothetical protein